MTRITRYFLSEFIRPLSFAFGTLIVLVLVSELMEHLDKFIAGDAGVGLVAEYLVSLLPMRSVEILPVAVLLATLFSLGSLSRRNEITAAMSGGVHPWRCVQLLLWAGAVLSVIALALGELVIPYSNGHAKTLWKMDIRHFAALRQTRFENLTVAGEGNVFYSIGSLDAEKQEMTDVVVEWMDNGQPKNHVQARTARWTPEGWTFYSGVEREYGPSRLTLARQAKFDELKLPLKETPEDLLPQSSEAEEMSYKEFKRHIRRLKTLGVPTRKQEVELHMKLAFPWTSLIVLLLGIPFAFQKSGGKVKAIGTALGVAFFYFGLMEVGRALGQKAWCPPLLGAWLANLVFLTIGARLFVKMRDLA